MKRSERMKVVHSVAEHEEKSECRAMGESQRRLEDEARRLEELNEYRQMYIAQGQLGMGPRASQWHDNHKFMNRLNEAVKTQENVVRDGKVERELHRNRWMLKRQRLESLSRIVDRYTSAEVEESGRQERKLEDAQPLRPGQYKTES